MVVLAEEGTGLLEEEAKGGGVLRLVWVRGARGRPGTRPVVAGGDALLLHVPFGPASGC